jgi:hypothetical protein
VGWLRPEEDADLMAKGEVLGEERGARTKKGAEGAESESNEAKHRDRRRSEGEPPRSLWGCSEVQENEGPMALRTPGEILGEAQGIS